tara:strand:- start:738 stop:1259 length:522 start_codon:yes stop_codon:yes gene_type:complete
MSITTKAIHNLAVKKEKASDEGKQITLREKTKYMVTEKYEIHTGAKPETIRGLIVAGQIPNSDYKNYELKIDKRKERYFFHSFEVHEGFNSYVIQYTYTLEELHQIAKRTNCEGTDEEVSEDSHMILLDYGFTEVDDIDEDQYWNFDRTKVASLSHIDEITEEEYEVLERRLR